jgi:hypothetical protein
MEGWNHLLIFMLIMLDKTMVFIIKCRMWHICFVLSVFIILEHMVRILI